MIDEREKKKKKFNFKNKSTLFGIRGKDFKISIL